MYLHLVTGDANGTRSFQLHCVPHKRHFLHSAHCACCLRLTACILLLQGRFLAAIGSRSHVFEWALGEDGTRSLEMHCTPKFHPTCCSCCAELSRHAVTAGQTISSHWQQNTHLQLDTW